MPKGISIKLYFQVIVVLEETHFYILVILKNNMLK